VFDLHRGEGDYNEGKDSLMFLFFDYCKKSLRNYYSVERAA
jgi:hypothetical protein